MGIKILENQHNGSYEYIIIGAGICGCSVAYELSQKTQNILLLDKASEVAQGASGAAGAFLSPLLGKPNGFKSLVTKALKYSTQLYKDNFESSITTCGTTRIPKDYIEEEKFQTYIPYIDFDFVKDELGYFFPIGSLVNSVEICQKMSQNIEKKFGYEVSQLEYDGDYWILNNELKTKNIVLATGYETNLLEQFYIKIRPVWGRRIDIQTSTNLAHNYHKACSVSKSFLAEDNRYFVSIGATHHRDKKGVEDIEQNSEELLEKANDIIALEEVEILRSHCGARASSVDYFPMIGKVINSVKTIEQFPYLKNGTHVEAKRFSRYENLYLINAVGGRGFVLAPYLAKQLVSNMLYQTDIEENLKVDRLFQREVRKIK